MAYGMAMARGLGGVFAASALTALLCGEAWAQEVAEPEVPPPPVDVAPPIQVAEDIAPPPPPPPPPAYQPPPYQPPPLPPKPTRRYVFLPGISPEADLFAGIAEIGLVTSRAKEFYGPLQFGLF